MHRFLGAALLAAALPAFAAHPLITEDTGTQGKGRWQLEGFSEDEKSADTGERSEANTAVLSFGIAENLDLQGTVPWYRDHPEGVGDLSLGAKWRFFERGALSFALRPDVTVPTGNEDEGHGTGRPTLGVLFVTSYASGPWAAHGHLGYRYNDNKVGERKRLNVAAAALTYQWGSLRLVGELARETNAEPGGRLARYSTVGAIWSVTRDFDLDAGWRRGYGGAELDDAFLLGATARW